MQISQIEIVILAYPLKNFNNSMHNTNGNLSGNRIYLSKLHFIDIKSTRDYNFTCVLCVDIFVPNICYFVPTCVIMIYMRAGGVSV